MTKVLAAALFALSLAAVPAAAATYVSSTSFNATNGSGGFSYGYTDGTTAIAFDSSSNCVISGSICLNSSAQGNLPQASLGGSAGTVNVPADKVLLHPGNSDTLSVYGAFIAPTTTQYSYTIDLQSIGTDTTDGTRYTPFTSIGGVVTLLPGGGALPTYLSTGTLSGTIVLAAGEQFGVIIDRNTIYYGDSTSFAATFATVPEPATWAMLVSGFGFVGIAVRRRKSVLCSSNPICCRGSR